MKGSVFGRCALSSFGTAALLAGCGGAPPPTSALPNASVPMTQAATTRTVDNAAYKLLHSFQGPPDGEQPDAGLDAFEGELYGTTNLGGYSGSPCNSCGTVFRIGPDGYERELYRFAGAPDGAYPRAPLTTLGSSGAFVGTTYSGGSGCSGSCGTIFKISPDGSERVIYSFLGGENGSNPKGGVLPYGTRGYLGTTWAGGAHGNGTIYEVAPNEEIVLHSFRGGTGDGAQPVGNLVLFNGALYGVTQTGGAYGGGTVFEIQTNGSDERIVHSFNPSFDGQDPVGVVAFNGALYGATVSSGPFKKRDRF
jgi:uncharacterized repeat protein (TIGR03803 family)